MAENNKKVGAGFLGHNAPFTSESRAPETAYESLLRELMSLAASLSGRGFGDSHGELDPLCIPAQELYITSSCAPHNTQSRARFIISLLISYVVRGNDSFAGCCCPDNALKAAPQGNPESGEQTTDKDILVFIAS